MENEKFSMNEQIKDLKIQVMNKQGEIGELKTKLGKKSKPPRLAISPQKK